MRERLTRLVERARRTGPVRLAMRYGDSHAGNYASGLAFNAFLSMFPLILGLLTIVGLLLGNLRVQTRIQQILFAGFSPSNQATINAALTGFHRHAGVFGLVAILGLIWTGIGFFGSMEFAFDQIHDVKGRDFIHQKVMGVIMMAVFLAGILISVGASAAVAFLPAVPFLGVLVGWAALTGLLVSIYVVVPNVRVRVAEVWPGALLAGLLIEVLTLVFPLYAKHAGGANTYGATFALFFLLAGWLYLLSQFLLLGLVLNRLLVGDRPRLRVLSSGKEDSA
ncbi:MAG: YihY/virulence factor BrkB family protein [Candidatus Dormibacteraceae bacterium]